MSLICTTVTTWITQQVLSPVDTWVNQQQQKCNQFPWWDPRGWFCWFVTVLVKLVVWVTQHILVPILETTCIVVTAIIYLILAPFGAAIDAVCSRCNAVQWIKDWFLTLTKITFVKKEDSSTNPGYFDYSFICNCNPFKKPSITIQATNDEEAATLAKLECEKECG